MPEKRGLFKAKIGIMTNNQINSNTRYPLAPFAFEKALGCGPDGSEGIAG